jgi:DNA polymerase-3 subunit epsilon
VDESRIAYEKRKAAEWARKMLSSDPIIVDLETTGLKDAEIVQIGVINAAGDVLMDTLVHPTGCIPSEATRIHGITDAMVADAATFTDLYARFSVLLAGKIVVAYNVSYEKSIIRGECKRRKLPVPRVTRWQCAMKSYAQFWGEWNSARRSFKWQKLGNACKQQAITLDNAHNAIADCKATLALVQTMAQFTG